MTIDREAEGEDPKQAGGLSLYGYPQCPFCRRVQGTIDSLGLEIPLRNTLQDPEHQRAVVEAMGRATVPVLRIEDEAGEVTWLPESADIVRYLAERFGDTATDDAAGANSGLRGWFARHLGLGSASD